MSAALRRLHGPRALVWLVALWGAAAVVAGGVGGRSRSPRADAFARATGGGIRLGAVRVPRWCYATYDPRLQPACLCPIWPIPGGICFCPDHGSTVVEFPRVREGAATVTIHRDDAGS